jgi:hypothetical protein
VDYDVPVTELFVRALLEGLFELCSCGPDGPEREPPNESLRSICDSLLTRAWNLHYALLHALDLRPYHPTTRTLGKEAFRWFLLPEPMSSASMYMDARHPLFAPANRLKVLRSAHGMLLSLAFKPWSTVRLLMYKETGKPIPLPYPGSPEMTYEACMRLVRRVFSELLEQKYRGASEFKDLSRALPNLASMDQVSAQALIVRIQQYPTPRETNELCRTALESINTALAGFLSSETAKGSVQSAAVVLKTHHSLLKAMTQTRVQMRFACYKFYWDKGLFTTAEKIGKVLRRARKSKDARYGVLKAALHVLDLDRDQDAGRETIDGSHKAFVNLVFGM